MNFKPSFSDLRFIDELSEGRLLASYLDGKHRCREA